MKNAKPAPIAMLRDMAAIKTIVLKNITEGSVAEEVAEHRLVIQPLSQTLIGFTSFN